MAEQRLRVAAYAVVVREQQILLARYLSPDRARRHWTLPGGKVEHAEDPYHAVVREAFEETGYHVDVERLLGVDSRFLRVDRGVPGGVELHHVGVFYRARIAGGELRNETDGSTDLAGWVPLPEVPGLERAVIVDIALEMERTLPPSGHVEPIAVNGMLRH